MDIKIYLLVLFMFHLCWQSESRRHHRRNKFRAKQNITLSLNLSNNTSVNLSPAYSPWLPWSKCNHKCKRRRVRRCIEPLICGINVMQEVKPCAADKCLKVKAEDERVDVREELAHHKNSTPKDFEIYFHMPQIFSEWSTWTPCSEECMTTRTQSCLIHEACGQKTYSETAICYTEGTECEKKYGTRRNRNRSGVDAVGKDVLKIHPFTGFTCGVAPMASHTLDLRDKLRIIGGRESKHGMWPWQVAILNRHREPFCGGTLISYRWVLTAAHCMRHRMIVRSGEHNLLSLEGTEQESLVAEKFVHPDYNVDTVSNDIALLRLRKPFRFNNYTQAACLPEAEDVLEAQAKAIIVGWGKRKSSAIFGTDHLHQAEVPIVSLEDCRQNYANYPINDKMLCAGHKQGRIDSCAGDSGGPLLSQKDDKWTVYGITSFGDGCGKKGKFGIYSKVTKFVKWIKRTISKFT